MDVERPILWEGSLHKTASLFLNKIGLPLSERACMLAILLQYTQHPILCLNLMKRDSCSLSLRMRSVRSEVKRKGVRRAQLFAKMEIGKMRYEEEERRPGRK